MGGRRAPAGPGALQWLLPGTPSGTRTGPRRITNVPAVVIDAPSFQYVTPAPGLFDHEVAFSDRPPSLADFWNDAVATDATQPVVRKVVRIRADQIVVQG
jgi:hypothetical protein